MNLPPRPTRRRGLALVAAASMLAAAAALGADPVGAAVRVAAAPGAANQADPVEEAPPVEPDPGSPSTDVLALAGSVTEATVAGGGIDGVVTVTNIGSEDMVRAALTIDTSVDETLVEVVVPAGWTCRDVALVAGQDLFCDASTFVAGSSATFSFRSVAATDLEVGALVVTTVTANAELPVQDVHPLLALTTRIVAPASPAPAPTPAPVAVAPQFTG